MGSSPNPPKPAGQGGTTGGGPGKAPLKGGNSAGGSGLGKSATNPINSGKATRGTGSAANKISRP